MDERKVVSELLLFAYLPLIMKRGTFTYLFEVAGPFNCPYINIMHARQWLKVDRGMRCAFVLLQ
jgi:hypothetical protein